MKNSVLDLTIKISKIYRILMYNLQKTINNNSIINGNELLLWYEINKEKHKSPQQIAEQGLYVISYVLFNLKNLERKKHIKMIGMNPEKTEITLENQEDIFNIIEQFENNKNYQELIKYAEKIEKSI